MRRVLTFAAATLVAANCTALPAAAQDWPTRPVTMVVPFPPGGGTDVLGRIVGRRLSEVLGQQVIIENVGGAGGMIGSARVVHATPDGYEFVLGSRADAINQTLYKHPLYDFKKDLTPVVLIAEQPMTLITRRDLPIDGLQDFIAYVKKNQSTMRSGSAGIGSTGYVDCALFNEAIGVHVQDIPYRGGGPALQDLIGGQFDYFCTLSATAVPPIQSNLVKGIAVFRHERLPSLPNLPTAYEQGMPKDLRPRPGSASLFRPARRRRSLKSCTMPPSTQWIRRRCSNNWLPPARSWCRPSTARRSIWKAPSLPKSSATARRSRPPECRLSEGRGALAPAKSRRLASATASRHGSDKSHFREESMRFLDVLCAAIAGMTALAAGAPPARSNGRRARSRS